jgi:hypothetical protein
MRVTQQDGLLHVRTGRGKAMFDWLRRGRNEDESKTAPPMATAVRESPRDELTRVGWRLLGTSPADKALLASLLANPPAWGNNLGPADLQGGTVEGAPATASDFAFAAPGPMSAGLRAPLASQAMFGPHFTKGASTWDHPARG